jgi:quercetin dioxygenase-like cupin family protein
MSITVTYGKGFEVQPSQSESKAVDVFQESVVSRERVMDLQNAMMEMPQAPGMPTSHFFTGGMYCRRIEIPKGTVVVSKVHKTEHFFIGCVGELEVAGQGDTYIIRPGDIVPSPIGTKRVVLALTDVVVLTVHKTDKTAADAELEAEMIEIDPLSKYDVNNQPKSGVLVCNPDVDKLEN